MSSPNGKDPGIIALCEERDRRLGQGSSSSHGASSTDRPTTAPLTSYRDATWYYNDLKARERGRELLKAEKARELGAGTPTLMSLRNFLAIADEPAQYLVSHLWPIGGNVMLAAQYKSGKTTMRDNVIRCLADGERFLDTYSVVEPRRVVVIDAEMDERALRRWVRAQGIRNVDNVSVLSLRGRVAAFNILDDRVRSEWAELLRGHDVVILDCLRPVLDALGLSEHTEAGRFLVAHDALVREAGASESMVIHHAGHGSERSRGDSRLLDWPDVTWKIVREKDDDPSSPRYFSAFGRDVDHPESAFVHDPATRHLSLAGGSRRDRREDAAVDAIVEVLRGESRGLSGRAIERAIEAAALGEDIGRNEVRAGLKRAIRDRVLTTTPGPTGSILHRLSDPSQWSSAPVRHSAPPVRQRTGDECASAPYREAHSHTRTGAVSEEETRRTESGDDEDPQAGGGGGQAPDHQDPPARPAADRSDFWGSAS